MMKIFGILFVLTLVSAARAQSTGSIEVRGEAGKLQIFQKVKAVRCEVGQRGKCDAAIFFGLNKPTAVKPGSYILGFENSIYPGFVKVDAGETTAVNLERLPVPAGVKGEKVRVFRDLSAAVEQNKILFSMFHMNRHFFRLDKENFGDLYLTGTWERDFVQRFTYEACAKITTYKEVPKDALAVCAAWNKASSYSGLKELYSFKEDGTMIESWVTFPGDITPSKHPRYLVSAPMSATDFVGVFPGSYKFSGEGKSSAVISIGEFTDKF